MRLEGRVDMLSPLLLLLRLVIMPEVPAYLSQGASLHEGHWNDSDCLRRLCD